ncbi:MAG: sigma-70 family RNA polymerase sigma factor [Sedimentisphaerales bacterium]|nr:sigma-70 family RNA polymerase sigma factor [Sedimentisphaerales bacterium]
MDTNKKRIELTDYALELVHHKARQIIGKAGYTQDDLDDIKQDLIMDLLERLPKFDPAKATYNTFVARVVERKICNLLRDRQAEMRDHRRNVCSLNEDIDTGEGEPVQRVTMISQDDHDLRTGKYRRPAEERAHLHLDLETVLADLSPELRQAAVLLQTMSVSQAAREMDVPRRTFREKHLVQLHEALTAKGLNLYLS